MPENWITLQRSIGPIHSDSFYAQFTGFLGFVPNSDEWKVMGLAPYGQPGIDLSAFIDLNAAPYRVHSKK